MATRGSGLTATGLALTLIAFGAGVGSAGTLVLLLNFAGVLAGASFIFVGVRVADDPTAPIGRPGLLSAGVRALLHCLRRNLALVGLLMASSAVSAAAAADREAAPVLCFCAFALMLLGISLLNIGVLLGEQEL
ncbi:unnamed protein product [Miscanthus lutarioriparius]|uniref:Uncharacterized protein n=1 Tax=Miscanthus lutarioriparius TaxID=422564 RepID=A0A811R7H3_9POAL|nr:unnamed protein product [Miscanthus lutarioriparius]CAD6266016.1 unnamed protein product [Miscanthus lutarioriparius]